jgi:very-short-patch-repair endonuclease
LVLYQHFIENADSHGLLYRPNIVPALASRSSWARAIRSGALVLEYPNVARLAMAPQTTMQQITAAHLACGSESLIAGPTAAWLLGASIPEPKEIHVLTTNRLTNAHRNHVLLHRPVHHALVEVLEIDGVPTTAHARTIFDVAAWSPQFLHSTFESFLVQGTVSVRSTWRSLFQIARQGRPGITRVRNMLNQWNLDTEQPESVLEAKMLSLCFTNGLPPFEFQAEIGPYRVDFLWREQMAIVECDGFAYHGSTRGAFERDRQRDAYLQSLGYTVWRFSFRQITNSEGEVVARLRSAFRRNV